jgi:hypothetical protein
MDTQPLVNPSWVLVTSERKHELSVCIEREPGKSFVESQSDPSS